MNLQSAPEPAALPPRLISDRRVVVSVFCSWFLLAIYGLSQEHVRSMFITAHSGVLGMLTMYTGGTLAWIALTFALFAVVDVMETRRWGRLPALLLLAVTALGLTLGITFAETWLQIHTAPPWRQIHNPDPYAAGLSFRFHDALWQAWQVAALGILLHRWNGLARDAGASAVLKKELADEQMRTLRARLEPHLLYNTLNSITELVTSDPGKAERVLVGMSELLRMMTYEGSEPLARVRDEIRFAALFLEIQALRLGDRLRVEWSLDAAAMDVQVPTFVLQPLVENAIKHGRGRAHINIRVETMRAADGLFLRVKDNGDLALDDPFAAKRSLANLRTRLQSVSASAALTLTREGGGTAAEIFLPTPPG
ncbi:MAG: histidine kinase [Acidobacteria bacterium]|nr:histidine kinase [Acidobacteriota bacterium]MBV9478237.1 histidine kinase [Acidobacteriota bacterium]